MSRYRPVEVRLWRDEKFLGLSQPAQFLWVYLLTCPEGLAIPGVIIGGPAALGESLGWTGDELRARFSEIEALGMAKADWRRRLVWLPNGIKHRPPANGNVILGWADQWDEVPDCPLKAEIWHAFRAACARWPQQFLEAFAPPAQGTGNGIGNPSPNRSRNPSPNPSPTQEQDQEQEQEQEQEGDTSGADATRPHLAGASAVDNSVAWEPQPACSSRPAPDTAPERAHERQDATNAPTPQVDSGPEIQPASDPPTRSGEALVLALVPAHPKADPVRAFAEAAVTALNRETGHTYRVDSEAVLKSARQLVAKRFTPADAIAVVEAKVAAWRHDPKMAEYLRPTTLLRPSNFAAYVDDLRAGNKPRVGQHDRRGPSPQHTSVLGALLDRQAELEALEQAGAMS
jgi:uncharacterized phage protein (TIGR02220 family)